MENKIIVDAKLVLSKQQLYLICLFSGEHEIDAKESSEFLFNNPDRASVYFSKFCSEWGGYGSTVNDILTLGLLSYFKKTGETLKDEDVYHCYLSIKKFVVKEIEVELQDIEDKYIDKNYEPLKK